VTSIDGQLDIFGQLTEQVDEKLDAVEPEWWGEEINLAEQERFYGRYLDVVVSPVTDREVLLLLARTSAEGWDGPRCYMRMRTVLRSQLDDARPSNGDCVAIARGKDKEGQRGAYHTYAVVSAPCPDPLPAHAAPSATEGDVIPF
jgi:hypothetical protein